MEHEEVSGLLGGFVRGDLEPERASDVAAHLEECAACSRERAGLEALLAVPAPALTERERRDLRAAVQSSLRTERTAAVAPPARRSFLGRAVPALALLAVVALGFVAAAGLFGDGADEGSPTTLTDGGAESEERAGEAGGGAGAEAGPAEQGEADSERTRDDDALATNAGVAKAPRPRFEARGRVTQAELQSLGRSGRIFQAYARLRAPVTRRRERFVDSLQRQARPAERGQIGSCAQAVFASRPSPILPAFGARAELGDRPVLVLGFVWTDRQQGPLRRYMLWAWPRGSCSSPLSYQSGFVKRG